MALLVCVLYLSFAFADLVSANLNDDIDILYGPDHIKVLDNGRELQLSLDKSSGSGFQSKNVYLFAKLDMNIKLVPNDSAGTVTAFYLSSQGSEHDELDYEFLGNLSGDPYVMQTNVFSKGGGNREEKFNLWFDPTTDFHTYSLLWNPLQIIFSVDGIPVRLFENNERLGVPYPENKGMRMYSTLWDGSNWATRGGKVKIDWSKAPFVASFRDYMETACIFGEACPTNSGWMSETLNERQKKLLDLTRKNYMIYGYCSDLKRFPKGLPRECIRSIRQLN